MHCESDKLSEQVMGRIALKLLIRGLAKNKEIFDAEYRRREVPNIANQIGEKPEDLQEFARCITPCVVGRIVGSQQVSMGDWVDTK